jgi:opacity protein-like surface antigen
MKYFAFSVISILLISTFGMAQSIGLFAGYLNSAFEDQTDAAGGFELGATFVLDALPVIEAGAEYSTTVSPFEFESEFLGQKVTSKFSNSMFGVYGKFNISVPAFTPYIRAGAGYYSGSVEVEVGGQSGTTDFKNTLGFNVGAGIETFTGFYAEFVYHLVSKELDVEDAASAGANYWGLRAGYLFSLL